MKPIAIIASGAVSPLGEGAAAYFAGDIGSRAETCVVHDRQLSEAGLRRPQAARAAHVSSPSADRAWSLLDRALELLLTELERRLPSWRQLRVGVALGTSSGGLGTLDEVLAERAQQRAISQARARAACYFGPLAALDQLGVEPVRLTQVLSACASSTVALGVACRWLEAERCDLVIAGGYDALTAFAATGFEALGATTASTPRPFRKDRDGLALGEGAALLALIRPDADGALGHLLGFGLSCDAVHVTAPDRSGAGLVRAARAALADAELEPTSVDMISAHATATPFNDSAEARAIAAIIGPTAERVVVHGFKSIVGHTLGAAGALELLAALDAGRRGVLPPTYGEGELETEFTARLCAQGLPGNAEHVLKLSTAFGGANAALVAAPHAPRRSAGPRVQRRARLRALGEPQLLADAALMTRFANLPQLELERLDHPSALALSAISSVLSVSILAPGKQCGVIIGTTAATLEVDELFAQRVRERGARGAEPRRFPATSPNLAAGRAAIAFGLSGPALAVGSGTQASLEALLLAIELLESGDAESLFVVACEDVGPVVRELFGAAGLAIPEPGALAALLDTGETGMPLESAALAEQIREERAEPSTSAPGWPQLKHALLSGRA